MDRREFLAASTLGVTGACIPKLLLAGNPHEPVHFGWVRPDPIAISKRIRHTVRPYLLQQANRQFIGSGKGKIVLLHKYLARALGGTIIPHAQEGPDCVGQAFGFAVDTLAATQIHALGLHEKFVAKASTEAIYAGSRFEIGATVHGNRKILLSGGSWGAYAAEYLRDYGVLIRKKYGDIDLTNYNWDYARLWGRTGVPDELEPIARLHPVRSFALVRSYADCRDAIANGYPVVLCSDRGFNPNCRQHNRNGRDSEGFLNPCGTWMHAMCAIGVDDTTRPGLLIMNSWGSNWVDGPTRLFQPPGSFWADADAIDYMCSQEDSFAISGYVGFRTQPEIIDYDLF